MSDDDAPKAPSVAGPVPVSEQLAAPRAPRLGEMSFATYHALKELHRRVGVVGTCRARSETVNAWPVAERVDEWGEPIGARCAGKELVLTSAGPDRSLNTRDDASLGAALAWSATSCP